MEKVVVCNNQTPHKKMWLVLVDKEGGIYRLQETNIPGVTIRSLSIPKDMKVITGEGPFLEVVATTLQLKIPATWTSIANDLKVREAALREFLHRFFPSEAEELNRVDNPVVQIKIDRRRWEFHHSYI